jgi:DNA-binding MarR family transcriptional regulator
LALVLFFHRHPRALLPSDRLAAFVGYNLKHVTQSLDLLAEAGLVEQSQHPTQAARLYVLKTPESEWLAALLEIASTREGRRNLIAALPGVASTDKSGQKSPNGKDRRPRVARAPTKSR